MVTHGKVVYYCIDLLFLRVLVSHKFGYGLMNAGEMVALAEQWTTVPPQHICKSQEIAEERYVEIRSFFIRRKHNIRNIQYRPTCMAYSFYAFYTYTRVHTYTICIHMTSCVQDKNRDVA